MLHFKILYKKKRSFIYVIYLMFKKHFKVYHPVSKFFIGLVKITGLKNIKRIKYGKKRKIIKALTLAKNKKLEV